MFWPDDDMHAKKPRYSAETGSKLVVNKDNDLQNVKNDLEKLRRTLEETRLELDETVNKLRGETTRNTKLEERLRLNKEELTQERLSRENLESELHAAGEKCKQVDQEQRFLQQQISDLSSQPNASDQQRKIINLEKTVSGLRAENARLTAVTERPPSRTSSIPVPKNRQSRSSSESRSHQVDEELRTCRAELVDAQKKCKAMETRMRKAETDSINSLNEKTAAERKTKSVIEELESALQEAKDEANSIRSEARNNGKQKADPVEQEKLQRERASALEQLEILKTDKLDLERKLSRKAAQCETLQEKLDNYMFSSEDDNLQLELATAKEDARRAKEQISLLKERMQDRELHINSLQEQLDRRESTSAALGQQSDRVIQLMHDREGVKDALAKSDARNRYVESQLQFRQHEMDTLRSQLKDCDIALGKSRALTTQQQELYSRVIQSCNEAEARVQELEKELQDIQDEMVNRSTVSEAAERNLQWRTALERVETLQSQLEQHDDGEPNPFRASTYQPPPGGFVEQPDPDAVARLVLGLQRIRDERDLLRGSVEFLNLELRAKDAAYEQRLAAERSTSLRILQSAENDIRLLSEERTLDHARVKELEASQDDAKASDALRQQLKQSQLLSMATLVALQHTHFELEQEHSLAEDSIGDLEEELEEERQAHTVTTEKLRKRFETTREAYLETLQKHDDVSRKYQAKCKEFTDVESERTRLQDALDEQIAVNRNLERECTAQMNDLKRLDEAHAIAKEELYEARVEADQLRDNHMSSLERQDPDALAALQRHIEELESRIIRRNEQIGVHQNDNRRLEMNLRIAESAVDEMRKDLEELRNQRGWLEEDAATVRQERNLAQKELEISRCELDTLKSSIDAKDAHVLAIEEAHSDEVCTLVGVVFDGILQNHKTKTAPSALKTSDPSSPVKLAATAEVEDMELLRRLESQSEELDGAKNAILTLTSDLEAKIEAFDETTRQMDNLKAALNDAIARGDTLASQLQRSTSLAQAEVREEMDALEAQIEALSSEVESLEERLAEGQQQIKEVIDQNGELEDHLTELETSHNATTREQREKMAQLEDQTRELQSLLDQAQSGSQEELEALKDELEATQADLTKSVETAESLESQVTTLEQDNSDLSSQLTQVKSDLTGKVAEIADLTRRLAETEGVSQELKDVKVALQEEQERHSKKSQELLNLQTEVDQIQQSLEQRLAALQRCQEERNDALKRLETVPRLQAKVNQLQEANTCMEKELQEAQQAASAAASTTVRDADLNIRIVQLETIISSMREENEELERVLTIKTKEIDEHDDRLIEVMKDRKKLVAKVDSLNRKVRNMQKQLDAATGVAPTDADQDSEANEEHPPSISLAIPISTSKKPQTTTPSTPQFESPIHMLSRATGYRPSRSSLPDTGAQDPAHAASPHPLSSSAPPISLAATTTPFSVKTTATTTPSTALGTMEIPTPTYRSTSTTQSIPFTQITQTPTPAATVITTPTSSSSSRKRRLPDDFDPCPGEQLPAMPVLSTSPTRLRKALREGAPLRTGFTPSRSRKSSAAASDKELAKVAAAAAASLNLSGTTNGPNFETTSSAPPPLTAKSSQTSLRTKSSNDQGLRELKPRPVVDITNAPKSGRVPGSSATLQSEYVKSSRDVSAPERVKSSAISATSLSAALPPMAPTFSASARSAAPVTGSSAPAAPRYRGGWLNRTAKPGGKSSSSTTSSRRPASPTLGSVALPKSVTGEHRLLSRGPHPNS